MQCEYTFAVVCVGLHGRLEEKNFMEVLIICLIRVSFHVVTIRDLS